MLHNSGLYGQSDNTMNMGVPLNMTQMTEPVTNNLSNIQKTTPTFTQTSHPHYNMPDYSTFNQLQINQQMNPFGNYSPMGFTSNYLSNPNFHRALDNNYPVNLNISDTSQGMYNNHYNYFDKKIINNHEPKKDINKAYPLNIPQFNNKYHNKEIPVETCFNNTQLEYDECAKEGENSSLNLKTKDSLMQKTSKAMGFLENLLIRNTPLRYNTDYSKESRHFTTSMDKQCESETMRIDFKYINNENELKRPLEENFKDDGKSNKSDTSVVNDEIKETADEPQTQINIKENTNNDITDNEKIESENKEQTNIDNNNVNPIIEVSNDDRTMEIKVEPMCWMDMEHLAPFQRDTNGVAKSEISEGTVIDAERSVDVATQLLKSGTQSNDMKSFFECPHCSIFIPNHKRFLIHCKWHSFGLTNDKRVEMEKEREFKKKLRREMRHAEKRSKEIAGDSGSDEAKHSCKDCDKVYDSKTSLKNHRHKCHSKMFRECKICYKQVSGWLELRTHMSTHMNQALYQCSECPKQFQHAQSLAKHQDTHLEKIHGCDKCEKKFGSIKLLKIHMKTHERVLKGATFRCTYCGKGFYEAYSLQAHERTHRNERPYQCDICKTSYGTNSSLQRHYKVSHSASKPHMCNVCHRSFSTEAIRDRHELRLHTADSAFIHHCKLCSNKYLTSKELRKHTSKVHGKAKRKKAYSDCSE